MSTGRRRHTSGPLHKYTEKLLINRLINLEHVSITDAHTWREWIQPITTNHPQVNSRFVSADTMNAGSLCPRCKIYLDKWVHYKHWEFYSALDSSSSLESMKTFPNTICLWSRFIFCHLLQILTVCQLIGVILWNRVIQWNCNKQRMQKQHP